MRIIRELKWFFKKEKKAYIIGILSLVVIAVCNLLPPKIMGNIVDRINSQQLTKQELLLDIIFLVILALSTYALRYVWRICIFGASFRLEKSMRQDLFDHFTKMSPTFFHEHRTGDLMAHATNDLKAIQRVAGGGILQFADALITGISTLCAMAFFVNWKLTIIAVIPMPLMMIGARFLGKKIHAVFYKAQEAFSNLNDKTHESINGIKVTKTFGQEKEEIDVFKEQTNDVFKKNMAVSYYDAAFDPLITVIIMICFVAVLLVGALFIQDGTLTIGDLVTFISYIHTLVWPMLAFGFLYNTIERGNVSYERIEKLLSIPQDIKNIEHPICEIPSGDIVVNIGEFHYPEDTNTTILKDIQLHLKQGSTLGIVGMTGSGKTTLLKLLLRDYDSYLGEISINHQNIKNYELGHLHQSIGYVPQDQFLFSATVKENICFGKPDASDQEIMEAAKKANIHEDILGFSKQYDTVVGERGVSLSGGQKQRIAIARALLLNPELLILDDSLSAVDAKTEEAILHNLKTARKNKTTIISAHRLSAIKHAQEIIVLHNGEISERGTHLELLKNDGWYLDIFERQEFSKGATIHHG